MKCRVKVLLFLLLSTSSMGCFSLHDTKPEFSVADNLVPQTLAQSYERAKPQKTASPSANTLAEGLGGILSSDNWIVYQEKEQEEFVGNVSYDNGIYHFKSDYALSERKLNRITAKGSVFLRKQETDGSWYQVQADTVVYNYQTGQGYAQAADGKRIDLQYKTPQGDHILAQARRANFNTKEQTCELTGRIVVTRTDATGQVITLKANRMTAKQQGMYARLQGNAEASNGQYCLNAQTIEYDGQANQAYAYGKRPLVQGSPEQGTFAIIADKATTNTTSRHIDLQGQVQGWIVSDTINQAETKKK